MGSPSSTAPFRILGISKDATLDEIKSAYKKQALRYHPDRSREDIKDSTEQFIEVNNAYKSLMRDRLSHSERTEKDARGGQSKAESNMPRKIAFPMNVSPSDSSSSSVGTMDSFDLPSKSAALSSPPTSLGSTLEEDLGSPFSKLESVHSTDATIDEGSVETLDDWVSVDFTPRNINQDASLHNERQKPQNKFSSRYPPCHGNHSHTHLHEYPITTRGVGTSKVWRYSLGMTLEDLFHGRDYRFRIARFYLSGMKENVLIDVHVPPGSVNGTIISCLNVGHQRRDGTFQDILFVVEELPHDTYARIGQDLVIKVQIPWSHNLRKKDGRIQFSGIDNRMLSARISYAKDKHLVGQYRIREAGMPVCRDRRILRRGDVIVQWEIQVPHSNSNSRWTSLKSWLRI